MLGATDRPKDTGSAFRAFPERIESRFRLKTYPSSKPILASILATVLCSSCVPGEQEIDCRQSAFSDDPDIFDGRSFDASLCSIYKAKEEKNAAFLVEAWDLVIAAGRLANQTDDTNRLQLKVLLAEDLYTLSPAHRVETSQLILRLSNSNDSRHREMAALALDTIEGSEAVETLFRLAADSDTIVSKYALQSLRVKQSDPQYAHATDQDRQDAERIARELPKLCTSEALSEDNLTECLKLIAGKQAERFSSY